MLMIWHLCPRRPRTRARCQAEMFAVFVWMLAFVQFAQAAHTANHQGMFHCPPSKNGCPVVELGDHNFAAEVSAAPYLVMFHAPWCELKFLLPLIFFRLHIYLLQAL